MACWRREGRKLKPERAGFLGADGDVSSTSSQPSSVPTASGYSGLSLSDADL